MTGRGARHREPSRAGVEAVLLAGAVAAGYLYRLPLNGLGNEYYAAATWAGTRDLTALAFGSLDPLNVITVDKPPLALWVTGLSGRAFGLSSWSLLAPQALMGVLTALTVRAIVLQVTGRAAALLAGALTAITPVAALMFRYNNPDAVAVLTMALGTWCLVRATRTAGIGWAVLAGLVSGLGFLAKMLGALLHLPALVLLYVLCAPATPRRKLAQLAAAAGAFLVSAGWYPLLTMLWPRARRPYLGGSPDDSLLQLALGYNGLQRMAGGTRAAFGSRPGPFRLFLGEFGIEISWLLPAALVGVAAVVALRRQEPVHDLRRGMSLMAATWLLTGWAALSSMRGPTHAYYSLVLVPPASIAVAVGVHEIARARRDPAARGWAAALVGTSAWAAFLVHHHERGWAPWLVWLIGGSLLVALAGILAAARHQRAWTAGGVAGLVALAAAPVSYTVAGLSVPHRGPSPSARPVPRHTAVPGQPDPTSPEVRTPHVVALLASSTRSWAAATPGSEPAARHQLAARVPVMGIGGYLGTDPAPTLQDFQAWVRAGRIGFYLRRATPPRPRRAHRPPTQAELIDTWVRATFPARMLDGLVVHDLDPSTRTVKP